MLVFYCIGVISPSTNSQSEDYPLSAVRDCWFRYIRI